MFLFGNKKKSTSSNVDSYGELNMMQSKYTKQESINIKILGIGCAKCDQLEKATKEALKILNMDATVEHITDFTEIVSYGVIGTPGMVVNGKVVSSGRVLSVEDVIKILQKVGE